MHDWVVWLVWWQITPPHYGIITRSNAIIMEQLNSYFAQLFFPHASLGSAKCSTKVNEKNAKEEAISFNT